MTTAKQLLFMDCRIFADLGAVTGLWHYIGYRPSILEELTKGKMCFPFLERLRSHVLVRDNTRDLAPL